MEDNMYPNEGEWFATPTELDKEKRDEQAKLRQAKPLIRDVLKRLDERIEFYDRIDSIPDDVATDPATHQRIVGANRLCRDNLRAERDYIMQLLTQK